MAQLPDTGGVWASSSSSSAPAPLTLSVGELARRAPRDISETHVMAGWEKIGEMRRLGDTLICKEILLGLVRPKASVPTLNLHRRVVFQD